MNKRFFEDHWLEILFIAWAVYYYFANYPDTALFGNTSVAHSIDDQGIPPPGNPSDMTGLSGDIYATH